jgi:hypothetical protein
VFAVRDIIGYNGKREDKIKGEEETSWQWIWQRAEKD